MRRPRIGFAGQFPGGPGQPSGPTTGVCLQWLDGAGCAGAKAPPIREAPLKGVLPSRNGRTAPGTEIAAGGAPGGAFPRSQGERERLASVPGGSPPPRRPRKPPRFPALYSPCLGDSKVRLRPGLHKQQGARSVACFFFSSHPNQKIRNAITHDEREAITTSSRRCARVARRRAWSPLRAAAVRPVRSPRKPTVPRPNKRRRSGRPA